MGSIFRQKVIHKKTTGIKGEVFLKQPINLTVTTLILLALFLVSITFAVNLKYGKHYVVSGWFKVTPEIQEIKSNDDGIIKHLYVKNGDVIDKGIVMSIVEHPKFDRYGELLHVRKIEQEKLLLSDIYKQYEIKNAELIEKISILEDRMNLNKIEEIQTDVSIEIAKENLKLSEAQTDRIKQYYEQGNTSRSDFERTKQEMLNAKASVNNLELKLVAISNNILTQKEQLANLKAQLGTLDIEKEKLITSKKNEITALEERYFTTSKSLISGVVNGIKKEVGNLTKPGEVIFTVSPVNLEWSVELLLPTNLSAKVKVGNAVKVAVSAFPSETYGHLIGKISQIDTNVITGNDSSVIGNVNHPSYKAVVTIDNLVTTKGKEIEPQNGLNVTVSIITDIESTMDKILRPFKDIGEHLE